jgi:hypothetical protein
MRWFVTQATGLLAVFLACLAFPPPTAAQSPSVWHATVAPTYELGLSGSVPWVAAWDFNGGGEWRQGPAGVGADISWFYFPPVGSTLPIVSVLGAYHFGRPGRPHTIEPFVNGGLGISTAGVGLMLDVGGGADWWLTSRVGIRTAVRDRIVEPSSGVLGFEVGVVFR